MRKTLLLFTTMALALLLAAGMASAITYGQPDGNRHPNVGAVVVAGEQGESVGCTGTLLASAGLLDQLANDGALKGQRFTVVGYGSTEFTHEPGSGTPVLGERGTRRYAVSSFSALTPALLRLSQNPSTGDSGACYGDSGGPNFLGAGPSETNIIASIGAYRGDVSCQAMNATYRLDTPSARAFLGQFVTLP